MLPEVYAPGAQMVEAPTCAIGAWEGLGSGFLSSVWARAGSGEAGSTGTRPSIVAAALDAGINYVDTADIYGTWYEGRRSLAEEYLGAALEGLRERVVLGTKGCQATGDGPSDWGASR